MFYVVAIEDQLSFLFDEEIYKEANHRVVQYRPQQSAEDDNVEVEIEFYCVNIPSQTLCSSRRGQDNEVNVSILSLVYELAEGNKKLKQLQYIIKNGDGATTEQEQALFVEVRDADSEEDPDL